MSATIYYKTNAQMKFYNLRDLNPRSYNYRGIIRGLQSENFYLKSRIRTFTNQQNEINKKYDKMAFIVRLNQICIIFILFYISMNEYVKNDVGTYLKNRGQALLCHAPHVIEHIHYMLMLTPREMWDYFCESSVFHKLELLFSRICAWVQSMQTNNVQFVEL